MEIQASMGMGVSAMNASAQNVLATANNVANLQSENYQARRLDQTEELAGGTRNNQLRVSEAQAIPPGGSNVELEREMVNLIADQNAYAANTAVTRTANQMMGTVLDLKA
jgi:flagellar hook protein FlgE